MLSKHRCSTCQAHKDKQQSIWYIYFSAPQMQVTWACLQSSLPIFRYYPTAAKAAALQPIHESTSITTPSADDWPDINNPAQIHAAVTQEERARWESWEAVKDETGIWTIRGKPILPGKCLMTLARWFHDKTHGGMTAVVNQIERRWAAPGIPTAVKRIEFLSHMLQVFRCKIQTGGWRTTMGILPIPKIANWSCRCASRERI